MVKTPILVSGAVEGMVDDAVVRRLIENAGGQVGTVHIAHGKPHLQKRIGAYNNAARFSPWIVLVDLDRGHACAAALRRIWLPSSSPLMCFRVAVRETESWLLADRNAIAEFLGVAIASVPRDPDALEDPKRTLVELARRSRRRTLREDMIPGPASGRSEGRAYSARIIEYVTSHWRPSFAVKHSDSLRRCCAALESLLAHAQHS